MQKLKPMKCWICRECKVPCMPQYQECIFRMKQQKVKPAIAIELSEFRKIMAVLKAARKVHDLRGIPFQNQEMWNAVQAVGNAFDKLESK